MTPSAFSQWWDENKPQTTPETRIPEDVWQMMKEVARKAYSEHRQPVRSGCPE